MAGPHDDIIRSRHNPFAKRLRTLWDSRKRDSERSFIVEGFRAIEDGLLVGADFETLVVSDQFDLSRLSERGAALPRKTLTEDLFTSLADTQHPQGILAIAKMTSMPDVSPVGIPLVLLLDGINDPGNLGTLLRSAAAAGVTAVYLADNTVDPYNPKVVRSGMGAHFRIPILSVHSAAECHESVGDAQVIACEAGAGQFYDEADYRKPTVLIIGNEARGISNSSRSVATQFVSIPLHNQTESVNASVAGSIILFEAERQRRGSV